MEYFVASDVIGPANTILIFHQLIALQIWKIKREYIGALLSSVFLDFIKKICF